MRLIFTLWALTGVLAAQTCTFTLSARPSSFPEGGGAGTVTIVASSSSCARTTSSNVSWIVITFGQQGTGDGSAGFTVAPDTDTPMRSGTITAGSQSVTITQTGPACNFAINPTSASLSALGQSGTFSLSGLAGCNWNASSNASWLQITSAVSGMGAAIISYTAQANSAASRSGAISAAGLTFTVNQAGACAYTVSPASGSYPSSGGSGSFTVSSNSGCAWTAAASAPWIHIASGLSGSGPGQVTINLDPNTGSARSGTISVGGQTFTITQAGVAGIVITMDSIANAASYAKGAVSPGLIVVIAVPGIGPADTMTEQITADGMFFTTQLAGVRVLFDGVPAPIVYAANGQFSAIVPYEVAAKSSTQMQVEYQGALSNSLTLPVVASQPGLISADSSGSGPGAITDQEYNLNSAANPAAPGSIVLLYATGEGQTSPAGIDGKIATVPLPAPVLPVRVTIDGIDAKVLYAGGASGLVAGLMQIDVIVPNGVASGARPVIVQVGQTQSQAGVTMAIQ